ncbi:hypothetical protein B0T22DRAFT_167129 [Podospora appendiculata]|uniref:F-box domain-containing protein n=1 Tax=Podospora appendiculata TaxID=314037 RepID=A0AAE0XAQ3_9PEZI|nr:hypothetical protein B0T22DRAFT_167129 [Podospora appendiculata]
MASINSESPPAAAVMSLMDFPDEVKLRILSSLDSSEDLLAVIGTCRSVNAFFEDHRDPILWSVIANNLGDNLRNAQGLLHIPTFMTGDSFFVANPMSDRLATSLWSAKAKAFAQAHLGDETQYAWPPSPDKLVSLFRLANILDSFITHCLEFFWSSAAHNKPTLCRLPATEPPNPAVLPMRPGERRALQRGMLRYEMMCRLFSIPYWYSVLDFHATAYRNPNDMWVARKRGYTAAACLEEHLPEREIEEVLAISQWVQGQHRLLLTDVRRELETVARAFERRRSAERTPGHTTPTRAIRAYIYGDQLHETAMRYLESPKSHLGGVDYKNIACGLGLAFLHGVLTDRGTNTTADGRTNLLRFVAGTLAPIMDGLEQEIDAMNENRHTETFTVLPPASNGSRWDPTAEWMAANGPAPGTASKLNRHRLRQVGWVFWDVARRPRAAAAWLWDPAPPTGVPMLTYAGPRFGDRDIRMLRQCRVTTAEWEDILRRFGAAVYEDQDYAMDPARVEAVADILAWMQGRT